MTHGSEMDQIFDVRLIAHGSYEAFPISADSDIQYASIVSTSKLIMI